jgi:hypothetical protein
MTFDNVQFDSPKDIRVAAEFADFIYGPGPMNLKLSGESVEIVGSPGTGTPNTCSDKFVPLPER